MTYEVVVVNLTSSSEPEFVEADSAVEAIKLRHPNAKPTILAEDEAWTGTPRYDGSTCWDSTSYPYIIAYPA